MIWRLTLIVVDLLFVAVRFLLLAAGILLLVGLGQALLHVVAG